MALIPMPVLQLTRRLSGHHIPLSSARRSSYRLVSTARSRGAISHHRRLSTNSPASNPPSAPATDAAAELTDRELLRRLVSRRTPQRLYWWLGGVVFIGASLVAFAPELKVGVSKHTADVATKSLQDETLQSHTRELASQIVQTVLNDPKVLDQASQFIQRLVVMDSTREALRSLVVHTLNDATTLANVTKLAKSLVTLLLEDAKTRDQVVVFLRQTIQDPSTRAALLKLLDEIMHDASVQKNVAQLLAQTFAMDPVKRSVATTISESVHDVLSRPDIQTHAKQFVGSVVQDQTVQAQSGDAIWGTVMYAITPAWLSWMWAKNEEEEEEKNPAVHKAVELVTQTVTNAVEADVALAHTGEALKETVAHHVAVTPPAVSAAATDTVVARPAHQTQTPTPVAPLLPTPQPGRFAMLRRLTRHLPLVGSPFAEEEDESNAVTKQEDDGDQDHGHEERPYPYPNQKDPHTEAERHWKGAGSGFL